LGSNLGSSFTPASNVREVPLLPADGSMPGYTFWKQLVRTASTGLSIAAGHRQANHLKQAAAHFPVWAVGCRLHFAMRVLLSWPASFGSLD
jgi:hypothetical protein